jgi:hypothetical protein
MIGEIDDLIVEERGVLEKFEGDPAPENLLERIYLKDGVIIRHEYFENGVLAEAYGEDVPEEGGN